MLGVILCGGNSTRMGKDKGLIPVDTKTWAGLAIEKMTALGIPVALSVNDRQHPIYRQIFSSQHIIPDNPVFSLKGPLAGLLSVHADSPAEDIFVLACDLPLMEPSLLENLYQRRKQQDKAQVYLYTNDAGPEPLCAIYSASGLDLITGLYQAQQLARDSMKYALNQLVVEVLSIPEDKKKCFENFNYPSGSNPPKDQPFEAHAS